MKLPDWMIKVTPLSKSIAMALFVALPFWGFYAGIWYQRGVKSPQIVINTNTTAELTPTPTAETTPAVSPTSTTALNYKKIYVQDDKSDYLEVPSDWNLESIDTDALSTKPAEETNFYKEDVQVTLTIKVSDASGNYVSVQKRVMSNPMLDCVPYPTNIPAEEIVREPGEKVGIARLKADSGNVYTYARISRLPTGQDEKYILNECGDADFKVLFRYGGKPEGLKTADDIYMRNILREKPLKLMEKVKANF